MPEIKVSADQVFPILRSNILVDGFHVVIDLEKSHGCVIADALDHRPSAAVAHGEALGGGAAEEGAAAGGAVQGHVADDDVVLRLEGRLQRRRDDELAAGQTLAHVVVGISRQLDGHPMGQPGTKGLAGGAPDLDADGVLRQPGVAVAARHLAREHGAEGAVVVVDRALDLHRLAALQGGGGAPEIASSQVFR